MNERFKFIRLQLKMNQSEFGKSLGVSRDVIANIEGNRMEPKDMHILAVSRAFNVSENWLRTGEGEPFVAVTKNQEIVEWVARVLADQSARTQVAFLAAAQQAPEEAWEHAGKFLSDFYKALDDQ